MKHYVNLYGEKKELILDNDALYELEDQTDIVIAQVSLGETKMSIKEITQLIWACLLHTDDELTVKYVSKGLKIKEFKHNVTSVVAALRDALQSGGEEEDSKKKKTAKPKE